MMEASEGVVAPGRKLGKAAPKYDVRTLRLASYIEKRKLPKVPQAHNLSRKTLKAFPDGLGMMENNELGDCTCAAMGHAFEAWTAWGGEPWRPTDADVVRAYNAVNGGVDEGAAMLDVLKLARGTGIGGRKIFAFVSIDPMNHDQVRTAHFLFGGLYIGAMLPVAAQGQKVWDVGEGSAFAPGSWGGHCMNVFDTTKAGLVVATWGALQPITWAWWDRYVDECYAVLDADFVGADKVSPQGFSLARLAADIKAI